MGVLLKAAKNLESTVVLPIMDWKSLGLTPAIALEADAIESINFDGSLIFAKAEPTLDPS